MELLDAEQEVLQKNGEVVIVALSINKLNLPKCNHGSFLKCAFQEHFPRGNIFVFTLDLMRFLFSFVCADTACSLSTLTLENIQITDLPVSASI